MTDIREALEAFEQFAKYLEDYGRLGGGEMKKLYGDEPLAGFDNILRHLRPVRTKLRTALADAGEWRDISTAPKDGTPVLLYGIRDGEIYGASNEPSVHYAYWTGNCWDVLSTGYYSVTVERPTLWCPVTFPVLPTPTEGDQDTLPTHEDVCGILKPYVSTEGKA